MSRVRYRFIQGWRQLTTFNTASYYLAAEPILRPAALTLFRRLSAADQRHAVSVYQRLTDEGPISHELAEAALLHDIGKVDAGLTLVHRTIIVILRHLAPAFLSRLSTQPDRAWRRPFYQYAQHASIGARLASENGCSARTAWLIEQHDLRPLSGTVMIKDAELLALQAADDAC